MPNRSKIKGIELYNRFHGNLFITCWQMFSQVLNRWPDWPQSQSSVWALTSLIYKKWFFKDTNIILDPSVNCSKHAHYVGFYCYKSNDLKYFNYSEKVDTEHSFYKNTKWFLRYDLLLALSSLFFVVECSKSSDIFEYKEDHNNEKKLMFQRERKENFVGNVCAYVVSDVEDMLLE